MLVLVQISPKRFVVVQLEQEKREWRTAFEHLMDYQRGEVVFGPSDGGSCLGWMRSNTEPPENQTPPRLRIKHPPACRPPDKRTETMARRVTSDGHFIPVVYTDNNGYELTLFKMDVMPDESDGWLVQVGDLTDYEGVHFYGPFKTPHAAAAWAQERHPPEGGGDNPFLAGNFAGK